MSRRAAYADPATHGFPAPWTPPDFNDPNVKCVANCIEAPRLRDYPHADASCCALGSQPNDVCWGPMCKTACYATEDVNNNFIGLRRVADGTLYAEYQAGHQTQEDVDFAAPTFYELFNATSDPWLMHNLHAGADAHVKDALHADLHAWYGCAGGTCP